MESYPFDDVTPEPVVPAGAGGDSPPADSSTPSRVRKIVTGAAIGVAVLATGGVAVAATHSGSTTAAGGPGGRGGPGGGFSGFGGPGGGGSESPTTGTAGPGAAAPGGATGATGGSTPTVPGGTAPGGTLPDGTSRSGPGGAFGGPGDLANILHGTVVVPATSGTGTTTEDVRSGKVTAVSATSLVVTSTDATVGSYVVTATTSVDHGQAKIGGVTVGDTVTVVATDADKKALTIEDRTREPSTGGLGGRPGGAFGYGGPAGSGGTTGNEGTTGSDGTTAAEGQST